MNIALVEDAEHDVDHEHGNDEQHREVRQRALERRGRALELTGHPFGQCGVGDRANAGQHVAKRRAAREAE